MGKLKEVTVYTDGDSHKIATWSNVPYFLTNTFEAKGIKVNRVNIAFTRRKWQSLWNITAKIMNRNTLYDYSRSSMRFFFTRCMIKKMTHRYNNSQADIFLTFSFSSAGFTSRPIILFGDWTYDHAIRYFRHRKPNALEKRVIFREDVQIRQADLVFALFPAVAEYMQNRYGKDKIFYLGNVINALYVPSEKSIHQKQKMMNLLFVGGESYKVGADTLIAAFRQLKPACPNLALHIIGMNADKWDNLPKDVFCYGYLDKGIDKERELYYKLFREATVFINTTPQWSAFSASVEAMYFYTPVIVSPGDEFVKTFGNSGYFGFYCEENSVELLKNNILNILNHKAYPELCLKAHEAVSTFTWDVYVDKMIEKIEILLNENPDCK